MRKNHLTISFILCLLLMTGCVHLNVQPLAAYDQAMKLPGPDKPKLFIEGTVKITSAMTAFAVIQANSKNASRESMIRNIWWKAAELKSDVVIIRDSGSYYAGSVGTAAYLGSGVAISSSTPVLNRVIIGFCLRLNPARIGFQTDQNQMIIDIYNDLVRDAGIIEGDKVVSINDFGYSHNIPEMLSLSPSQEVKITVIRPGIGRLTKNVKTIKNNASYLNYTDALMWKDEPKQSETRYCSSAGNCK